MQRANETMTVNKSLGQSSLRGSSSRQGGSSSGSRRRCSSPLMTRLGNGSTKGSSSTRSSIDISASSYRGGGGKQRLASARGPAQSRDTSVYCTPRRTRPRNFKAKGPLPKLECIMDSTSERAAAAPAENAREDSVYCTPRRSRPRVRAIRASSRGSTTMPRLLVDMEETKSEDEDLSNKSKNSSINLKKKKSSEGGSNSSRLSSSGAMNMPSASTSPAPSPSSPPVVRKPSSSSPLSMMPKVPMTPGRKYLAQTKKFFQKALPNVMAAGLSNLDDEKADATTTTTTDSTHTTSTTSETSTADTTSSTFDVSSSHDMLIPMEKAEDMTPVIPRRSLEPKPKRNSVAAKKAASPLEASKKRVTKTIRRMASATWKCSCGYDCDKVNRFCGICGNPQFWSCQECQFDKNLCLFGFCGMCGIPKNDGSCPPSSGMQQHPVVPAAC